MDMYNNHLLINMTGKEHSIFLEREASVACCKIRILS